jgi:dihydrofolate reductase
MGRLTVQQVVTLDGYAADNDGGTDYFALFPEWDEIDREMLPWLENMDRILLGANTYRYFLDYWPTAASDGELIAPTLNAMPKSVISSTLDSAPWGDYPAATIEEGDPLDTVRRLRETDNLVLWGSLTLMNSLLVAGLVDTLELRVLPLTLGAGRPLFTVPFRATLDSVRSVGDILVQTYTPAATGESAT